MSERFPLTAVWLAADERGDLLEQYHVHWATHRLANGEGPVLSGVQSWARRYLDKQAVRA